MAESTPFLEWFGATKAARDAFVTAWDESGPEAAVAAWRDVIAAHAANWESLGFPDLGAPETADRALVDIVSDAAARRITALSRTRGNNHREAIHYARMALDHAVDLEWLNDLGVMLHAAGRQEEAVALLRTCLLVDPERQDANENLGAMMRTGLP